MTAAPHFPDDVPPPPPVHQYMARAVANALETNAPDDVFVNGRTSVMTSAGTELIPDVTVLRLDRADRTPAFPEDVLLVIEVGSSGSRGKDYSEAGIPLYWVIDPLPGRVTFTGFELGADGAYRRGRTHVGLVSRERPWPVLLDLDAWTARRDQVRSRGR
ncbi:Uma2 family endonuclease [Symbioplanes lichenis]|uniref:Uma2 family endonuclease n=1 Tax=Symbioplanes lichenis TaxID=1629072 RepID=UPI00273A0943|nr:Uma2 family endonuclease [Actinoplanes lichenis]